MRVLMVLVLLTASVKSFGEVYRVQDKENNCELYLSSNSNHLEKYDSLELEKVSSMPALVFQKYNHQVHLKGLWALTTLVDNIDVNSSELKELMGHNFHSICLSDNREIVHMEKGRRLFNSLNDLDNP